MNEGKKKTEWVRAEPKRRKEAKPKEPKASSHGKQTYKPSPGNAPAEGELS